MIEEAEAIERFCPMLISRVSQDYPNPRSSGSNCRGSECMAWVESEVNADYGYCGMVRSEEARCCK